MSQETPSTAAGAVTLGPADRRSNFGGRGWSIITIQGLLIWMAAGVQTHGLNIVIPTLAEHFDLPATTLLSWATPAAWGGVAGAFFVAQWVQRWGAKRNIVISLAVCALAFGLLGTWGTIPGFVALFFLVNFFGTGFGYVGGLVLISNWFPRKKNLALGWVTMGQTMSTALFVPTLALFLRVFGVQGGFWATAAIMAILLVVVVLFVTDLPEQAGYSPDNIPMTPEQIAASRVEQESYVTHLTTAKLLRSKDIWLIGLGSGGVYVVLVAVLSQLVPRMVAMGYTEDQAILNMAIAAFIGVPGAYLWGWIGQRFSSRTGLIIYQAWWLVAVAINMLETNTVTLWISLILIGISFGGATNLTTSIVADKYRRGAFAKAFGIVQPIQGIVRTSAYALLAFGLTHLGGYVGAYALLLGVGAIAIVLFLLIDTTPVED